MTIGMKRALLVGMTIGTFLGMTACREDEQGRPMVKQKGVYEGPADDAIAEDRLEALRSRAAGQKF